ncbi:MAG: D-alanine--D-alanine ligase family protein [Actinomycetota bacterium]
MAGSSPDQPSDRVRLVVLFGGQSAEHDVSCVTARHVLAAASADRYDIDAIGITRQGSWVRTDAAAMLQSGTSPEALPESIPARGDLVEPSTVIQADTAPIVVLPLLHGPMGEDGTVQGLLDLADVPYVGTGVLGSALCMDKAMAKQAAASFGIPQVPWRTLHVDDLLALDAPALLAELGPVVFVKPANMGSSVGVHRVESADELVPALHAAAEYDEWIVVEQGVDAREIEVGVLGNRRHEASLPGEIVPGDEFYSYDDKYHDGVAQTVVPADLTPEQSDEVRALACRAAAALRVEGLARVDFFLEEDGRGFLLNEINTMPGFTPISMFPKLWEATGLAYPALIDRLVQLAVERHERRSSHRSTAH